LEAAGEAPIDAILPTLGGQTALNTAVALHAQGVLERFGVKMSGATRAVIHRAEDRTEFKDVCVSIGLDVARSGVVHNLLEARSILEDVRLPCCIRPAYTLGGTGGGFAFNVEEFEAIAARGLEYSPIDEILIEQSVLGWKEYELEVMRDRADNVVIVCSIENFDPMGIHTGDSITAAPAQTLTDKEYQRMRDAAMAIIRAVGVETGGANIQFAVHPQTGRMIAVEMNPRVSRSSALASKATGFPIAKIAAKLGAVEPPRPRQTSVKESVLPFAKFPGVDVILGPEMRSSGEVMGVDMSFGVAFAKSQMAAGLEIPARGTVFVSVCDADKRHLVPLGQRLAAMDFRLVATSGTHKALTETGMRVRLLPKLTEGQPNVADLITNGEIDMLINTPTRHGPSTDEGKIRALATMQRVPLFTTMTAAMAAADAVAALRATGGTQGASNAWSVRVLQDYFPHTARAAAVTPRQAGDG